MKRLVIAIQYEVCILFLSIIAMMALSPAPQTQGVDGKAMPWIHTPLFWIVVIGSVLIIAQTWANYLRQWYDPKWALYFWDRFTSKDILKARSFSCAYFKEHNKWNDQVDHVLDVIEDIAFNVKNDVISRDVAHHHFDYWVRGYLELTKDYRADVQRKIPTIWSNCDDLLKKLTKVESKQTNKLAALLTLSDEDKSEFLDEEIGLRPPSQAPDKAASPP